MPIVPFIIAIYILTIFVVFFTYFTAKIAQMKLRSSLWGMMGMLFGPVGMVLVCYLPSRRKDGKETNPIRSGVRALPNFSRKAFVVLSVLTLVILTGLYFWENIPKWKENNEYAKNMGAEVTDDLQYTASVKGIPATVQAGQNSTYLITEQGDLYTWGYNDLALSQQDKGAAAANVKAVVQMGRAVYVLKSDKKLYNISADGAQSVFGENVESMDASETFGAYVTVTGDVYVWGSNAYGQLGGNDTNSADKPRWLCGNTSAVACGSRHLLVLKKDGSVMACGSNVSGAMGLEDRNIIPSLKQIASDCTAIACGDEFSLLLTKDGDLLSAGSNVCGQLGREIEETSGASFGLVEKKVSAIGAGGSFGWYLAEKDLYTWGQNDCGQLGQGDRTDLFTPKKVMGGVDTAAASGNHLVILSEGKLLACGNNTFGQLGKLGDKHLSPGASVTVKK